jgi:hypothetical protein
MLPCQARRCVHLASPHSAGTAQAPTQRLTRNQTRYTHECTSTPRSARDTTHGMRQAGQPSHACNSGACAQDAQSPNRRTTLSCSQSLRVPQGHIRTRLDPLTLARYPDNPRLYTPVVMVDSTDPQPGVASVNPKPQCAFEELTFAKSCNSRYVSHFAAFFIDPRAE